MEELINNLNNWNLIKLFGGVGVVLSAIIFFISKVINQKIVHSWQRFSNIEIEELKGAINKNNSVVASLTQQFGQNSQKLLDKRIEVSEVCWDMILKTKSSIPASIYSAYNVYRGEELTKERLDESKTGLGLEIGKISKREFQKELFAHSKDISRYRPFISEKLWILMFAYIGFIGRSTNLLIHGYHIGNIVNWKLDSGVVEIALTVIAKEELKYILDMQFYAYDSMLQLLENKILQEIKRLMSSEDLAMDSLKAVEKINQILKQQTPPDE